VHIPVRCPTGLKYLSPTASRQALNRAGLAVREESAFQAAMAICCSALRNCIRHDHPNS